MAVNDWYARQFGERDQIAVTISLSPDPHPTGDLIRDATWGGLSVWVRGRCLTASISDGAHSEEIHWSLLEILKWFLSAGVRLINEEPFPLEIQSRIRDACEWLNETDESPAPLTPESELEWFRVRSEWRRHHFLRSSAVDVALPNLAFRRLGDLTEVSWDDETWGTARPGLRFLETRGRELVSASLAARVLVEAVHDCSRALADKTGAPLFASLSQEAANAGAAEDDWRWLMHGATARIISEQLTTLRDSFRKHVQEKRRGLYVPHTAESLILRNARLTSPAEIHSLLQEALAPTDSKVDSLLESVAKRSPAPTVYPFRAGYDRALDVREALGWGVAPAPDIDAWLVQHGVAVARPDTVPATIDLVSSRLDNHARISINPNPSTPVRRETAAATALGHLLMDDERIAVDGLWEHWPTSARARAFGVMLLLPREGIRRALAGREKIDADDVRKVMNIFGTGVHATTHHLRNLKFIETDERRDSILAELVA